MEKSNLSITLNGWPRANELERQWWGDCVNTAGEEEKQMVYTRYLDIPGRYVDPAGRTFFDLQGKNIIDIGGGPISLLLKCRNFHPSFVIDPCPFPAWVRARYQENNIMFVNRPAEEIPRVGMDDRLGADEVWIYNVLQHCKDPGKVIANAKEMAPVVRIFEWIETGTNEMHIHNLTEEFLCGHFPDGRTVYLAEDGCFGKAFYAVWSKESRGPDGIAGTISPLGCSPSENKTPPALSKGPAGKTGPVGNIGPATANLKTVKRFHLLGLAHLPTNKERALACAYSQKVLKMAKMLKMLGHEVLFYGVEGSTVECDEFIQVVDQKTMTATYGEYDHTKEGYKFDCQDLAYKTFNAFAIQEINKRKKDRDFLLIPFGYGQKAIFDAVNIDLSVEMGIGYEGTYAKYRVFESYAWMHDVYGRELAKNSGDGRYYDCVIPNYFDPDDFEYSAEKGDYFLYLGRIVPRKGVQVARETVEAIGAKLILAGQPGTGIDKVDLNSPNLEYVGFAGMEKRRELLSRAKALFVPTTYIEPFGGVSIEALFSGTPIITTDWGCFGENNMHGMTGYRCRTLEHFIWAARNIGNIRPEDCREFAMANFTLDRVAKMYDEYFFQLENIFRKGWYERNDGRKELDWLKRWYPGEGK